MNRPETDEYAEYYANYIAQVNGPVIDVLDEQSGELRSLLANLPEERGTDAYEEGKWTIKELLSHIIDGERVFAYRVLRISRDDKTPMEGFEQDGYIATSNANERPFADLLEEFDLQRRSNMIMVRNLSEIASCRMGTASGNPVSVRALVHIMAGHVAHHLNILRDRYL